MTGYNWKAKETNFTMIPSEYGATHFHDDDLTDGSGVCYSSRLRPILNMRPKYTMPILGGGTGAPHQLNADLHLTDWMETKGYQFDVATDEDLNFEGVSLL
jgi:N,N-dimethylformamidase